MAGTPVAALVVRVAADLAELKTNVGDITETLGKAEGFAKKAGLAILGAFSARALGDAARQAINATSEIADAAARLGVSAESVQRLKFAVEQSGGSIGDLGTAFGKMADVLGGPGGTKAMEQLGLDINKIRQMSPDRAFAAIADAIALIPDPMRQSDEATNIFGRGALALLPAIRDGIDKVGSAAPVMSNHIVASGDQAGDAWAQMQTRLNNLKAQAIIPVLDLFSSFPSSVQTVVGAVAAFTPSFESIGLGIMAAGGPMAALAGLKTALLALAGLLTFPAGLIAAAVVGIVAIWYKWDAIKVIAQNVYTAVKEWLVDKFMGIVDKVKGAVDAVTGFFKDMYEKVVGGSYVPDMIDGINAEFAKLDGYMMSPAQVATTYVNDVFHKMSQDVQGNVSGMLSGVGGLFGSFLQAVLPAFAGALMGGLADIAMKGLSWLGSKIWNGIKSIFGGGSGRGMVEDFAAGMGGFDALHAQLQAQLGDADAERLWKQLTQTDKGGAESAIDEIRRRLSGGIAAGYGGTILDGGGSPVDVSGSGGGTGHLTITLNNTIEMDGQAVGRSVDRYQLGQYMNQNRLGFAT